MMERPRGLALFALVGLSLVVTSLPANAIWHIEGGVPVPGGYRINSLAVLDDQLIWAVVDTVAWGEPGGTNRPRTLRSTDGGTTWDVSFVPVPLGEKCLDIAALDETTAWVTANAMSGTGGMYKTTDGGNSWVQLSGMGTNPCLWVAFFDDQNGVAVNWAYVFTTTDGGESWVPAPDPPVYEPDEYNIIFSTSNSRAVVGDMFANVTSKGRIMKSDDRGYHWSEHSTSLGATTAVHGVAFEDPLKGIICSRYDNTNSAARTADGGLTWTTLDMTSCQYPNFPRTDAITDIPETGGTYVIGGYAGSGYTTDHGTTWQHISNTTVHSIDFAHCTAGWGAYTYMLRWQGVELCDVTAVPAAEVSELGPRLAQNYPNPFNPSTTIAYTLPGPDRVRLTVHDVLGREIAILVDGVQTAGPHAVTFDAGGLPSGIYYYRLAGSQGALGRSMVVQK